ncbi:MAG: ABC transporter ATP-binding protein [Planctomycetes bacterium]|nr:ABC transporter ATP-binding protein [Planctomycetota bacterium]
MNALVVEGVSKTFRYCPQLPGGGSLKSAVLAWLRGRRTPRVEVAALRDVSFSVEAGEALGVLGANGAGKSTLLRLVAGAYRPDAGEVRVAGRVGRLLELGAGFHPDLSGAENAEIAALVAGLSLPDYRALRDSILAFSELGDFWTAPLRTYSNGMLLRLGFAVATAIRPSLLVVDEVLAVGDAGFQAKCRERIAALRAEGVALLVASHGLHELEATCERVLWLEGGRVRALDRTPVVLAAYRESGP